MSELLRPNEKRDATSARSGGFGAETQIVHVKSDVQLSPPPERFTAADLPQNALKSMALTAFPERRYPELAQAIRTSQIVSVEQPRTANKEWLASARERSSTPILPYAGDREYNVVTLRLASDIEVGQACKAGEDGTIRHGRFFLPYGIRDGMTKAEVKEATVLPGGDKDAAAFGILRAGSVVRLSFIRPEGVPEADARDRHSFSTVPAVGHKSGPLVPQVELCDRSQSPEKQFQLTEPPSQLKPDVEQSLAGDRSPGLGGERLHPERDGTSAEPEKMAAIVLPPLMPDASNKERGDWGELAVMRRFTENGFRAVGGFLEKPHGIDAVFEKSGDFYCVESKFGSSRQKMTADGLQGSAIWTLARLSEAVGPQTARKIADAGFYSVLAKVDKDGNPGCHFLDPAGQAIPPGHVIRKQYAH